jgi:hypothetical protein
VSLLPRTGRYGWFYEEFNHANGLRWLPIIAQKSTHHDDHNCLHCLLANILVDHIVFSIDNRTIQVPLSCSYTYLQAMGIDSTESVRESINHDLANLKAVIVWVLENSVRVHNSTSEDGVLPVLYPPELDTREWRSLDVFELHSFDFIRGMSDTEWEEWVTHLKAMIMGARLGGLKLGPFYDQNRFCRDPDNVCGRVKI